MKNDYPPFSVLMSVYKNDRPEFLNESLKSIENQSVKPNEIVVVEDGPISMKLKQVIVKHRGSFGDDFKVVTSKQNNGLAAALRLGTEYVSTNWIARMDSDDICVPNRFEKQLEVINDNPDFAVVGGQIKEFSGNIDTIVGYRQVPTSEEQIKRFLKWRSPFNHPTVMINKQVLQSVGGYVPFGNLEDYYLWARIIQKGFTVCSLDDVLVYMRADQGMYSRRGKLSNLKFFYKLRQYLRQNSFVNVQEEIAGDLAMTLNIMMPNGCRKILYKKILHKVKRRKGH